MFTVPAALPAMEALRSLTPKHGLLACPQGAHSWVLLQVTVAAAE